MGGHVAGGGLGQVLPQIDGALLAHERPFVVPVVAQDFLETKRIEATRRVFERGIVGDSARHCAVRHGDVELAAELVERRFGDEPSDNLLIQADSARLIVGDRALRAALQALQLGFDRRSGPVRR